MFVVTKPVGHDDVAVIELVPAGVEIELECWVYFLSTDKAHDTTISFDFHHLALVTGAGEVVAIAELCRGVAFSRDFGLLKDVTLGIDF